MSLKILSKKKVFHGQFTDLYSTEFVKNNGEKGEWEWIRKQDGVVVLPITADNKIILIENFRVPIESYNVELPAGLLDKKGEDPVEAAKRELLEETGYQAEKIIEISKYFSWPAVSDMKMTLFAATGCVKVQEPACEPSEDIKVFLVEVDKLFEFYEKNSARLPFSLGIFAGYYIAMEKGLIKK